MYTYMDYGRLEQPFILLSCVCTMYVLYVCWKQILWKSGTFSMSVVLTQPWNTTITDWDWDCRILQLYNEIFSCGVITLLDNSSKL